MTEAAPPPPDPLWSPYPPFADPVLRPPDPLPWDEPWQATTATPAPPPVSPLPLPPSRKPASRRTPATPPAPVRTRPPQPAPTDQPRRRLGRRIGVIVALLLCLGPNLARAIENLFDLGGGEPTATAGWPPPSGPFAPASVTVLAGSESSVGMPVGTAVIFTSGGNEWSVAVVGVHWLPGACTGGVDASEVVVVDVRVESSRGTVPVDPSVQFRYARADGVTPLRMDRSTGCTEPELGEAELAAPAELTGRIAFTAPSGPGGELIYRVGAEPVATWTIPAG